MSNRLQKLGKRGEQLGATFLIEKGYTIVEQNFRCKLGEIDLIARHGSTLVFIEVKTRTSSNFGTPASAVTKKKQAQISRVAQFYLQKNQLGQCDARFDVLALLVNSSGTVDIELIDNAFEDTQF